MGVPRPHRGGFLREADWLTGARALAWTRTLLVVTIVLSLVWIVLARDGVDITGKPLGTDFLSFYAASRLALGGHSGLAYDVAAHAAAERQLFGGGTTTGYYAFFYPPPYLLVCLPLALLPYGPALAAWIAATGLAYAMALKRLLGATPHATLAVLAFPAVALTAGHGQNALLTTALFATAILCSRERPVVAGIAFGLLAFKPQLGLMIPLFLVASGAWRTVATATLTVVAMAAVAALVFGSGIYLAFLGASGLARAALEQDLVGAAKMQSVFGAIQLWHGPRTLAWGVQALAGLAAAVALVRVVRTTTDDRLRGGALVAASLLASPFLLDYDLALLAIPLAVLWRRACERGFLPWERITLFAGFVLPLVSRMLASEFGLALAPATIAILLALLVREASASPVRSSDVPADGAPFAAAIP